MSSHSISPSLSICQLVSPFVLTSSPLGLMTTHYSVQSDHCSLCSLRLSSPTESSSVLSLLSHSLRLYLFQFVRLVKQMWWRNGNSDCLRAGWFRIRVLIGTNFSEPLETELKAHPVSLRGILRYIPEWTVAGAWLWPPSNLHLALRIKQGYGSTLPIFSAFVSW